MLRLVHILFAIISSAIVAAAIAGVLWYGSRFPGETRIVKQGERAGQIAAWDYTTIDQLERRNPNIKNINDIQVDQEMIIRDEGYKGALQLISDIIDYYYDRK